jgi:hypothetical protein
MTAEIDALIVSLNVITLHPGDRYEVVLRLRADAPEAIQALLAAYRSGLPVHLVAVTVEEET